MDARSKGIEGERGTLKAILHCVRRAKEDEEGEHVGRRGDLSVVWE